MTEKKKIIILMHYMELGGAEMALLGLLHALDPKRVDVDLFVYSHQGPLMNYIPKYVNLLPENKSYAMIERPIKDAIMKGQIGVAFGRLLAKYRHAKYRKQHPAEGDDISIMQYIGNAVTPFLPEINPYTEYDLCISFLIPHNIGISKVNAKKRLAWIHTDYATVDINAGQELPIWAGYDYIASISEDVRKSFLNIFPSLADKVMPIENVMAKDYILSKAEEIDVKGEFKGSLNLLSIGRFCTAKNYDNVPDICRRLVEKRLDLKWYIIGFGGDEALIRSRIMEADMQDRVILLGKKENPYPYIKACDIYVQPSRYEGKSITVREAQMLGKPVIVTNYQTAKSQINEGVDGVIVPMDNEGCAEGIYDFVMNKSLQASIVSYLNTNDFSNLAEVNKIYNLAGI